jgi:hypothetical protein
MASYAGRGGRGRLSQGDRAVSTYQLMHRGYYRTLMARRGTSGSLFASCWRQYMEWRRQGAIDDPASDDEVLDFLDTLAAERVNDSASRYYIYG